MPYAPLPLAQHERDSLVAVVAENVQRLGLTPEAARATVREGLSLPEYRPPVTTSLVDADGRIWLRREVEEEGRSLWQVFDGRGAVLAQVWIPRDHWLVEVRQEDVWALFRDSLDVPYLIRAEVVRE
ncbi:MAG TPA: hypothetical protein VMN39_06090 [Longimicrobiaceae bacterium]|nr:hypothetical protein [Longimicrobiaceae bacterium]